MTRHVFKAGDLVASRSEYVAPLGQRGIVVEVQPVLNGVFVNFGYPVGNRVACRGSELTFIENIYEND